MQRQSLETVLDEMKNVPYAEQYKYIKALLETGKIKPVKSSGKNGKKPALYLEYWLVEKEQLIRKWNFRCATIATKAQICVAKVQCKRNANFALQGPPP